LREILSLGIVVESPRCIFDVRRAFSTRGGNEIFWDVT